MTQLGKKHAHVGRVGEGSDSGQTFTSNTCGRMKGSPSEGTEAVPHLWRAAETPQQNSLLCVREMERTSLPAQAFPASGHSQRRGATREHKCVEVFHTVQRHYKCSESVKAFSYKSALAQHQRIDPTYCNDLWKKQDGTITSQSRGKKTISLAHANTKQAASWQSRCLFVANSILAWNATQTRLHCHSLHENVTFQNGWAKYSAA